MKLKDTLVQSYIARMEDAVWSLLSATFIASVSKASVVPTVRIVSGVLGPARMGEPAWKTRRTQSSTAATVPIISLDDTVRIMLSDQDPAPAPTCSASSIQGIKCAMPSVTTTNVTGMEETVRWIGSSRGWTAQPVFPAGISLRTDVVIRSVTTQGASLMALSARNTKPASMCTHGWYYYDDI